jgi:hypothetical protein
MTKIMRAAISTVSLLVVLGGCTAPSSNGGVNVTAQSTDTAGWTGRTFVVGSHSTVAGDAEATYLQQKWGVAPQK